MTEENQLPQQENPNDKLSTGLAVLSFCIPIAGAIIYFSNKDSMPNKAKSACHASLWGFGIGVVINILGRLVAAS
ncbi:MAG: hypothetical protein QM564_03730 [Bergeyella sp.]